MEKPLSPLEFAVEMSKIKLECGGDEEVAHLTMDDLMTEQLKQLGYSEGVAVFDSPGKWYA